MKIKGKAVRAFTLEGKPIAAGDPVAFPENQFLDFETAELVERDKETGNPPRTERTRG